MVDCILQILVLHSYDKLYLTGSYWLDRLRLVNRRSASEFNETITVCEDAENKVIRNTENNYDHWM